MICEICGGCPPDIGCVCPPKPGIDPGLKYSLDSDGCMVPIDTSPKPYNSGDPFGGHAGANVPPPKPERELREHLAADLEAWLPLTPCLCTPIEIDWGHKVPCWKQYMESGLRLLKEELGEVTNE